MNERWELQIFWAGKWRTILRSNKRSELAEYAVTCPEHLQIRIRDTREEGEKRGGRH